MSIFNLDGKSPKATYTGGRIFGNFNEPSAEQKIKIQTAQKKAKQQSQALIKEGLKRGMSWEDIASQTQIPLQEVQALSKQINPNYGVKPAGDSYVKRFIDLEKRNFNQAKSMVEEVSGANKRQEQEQQQRDKYYSARKKAIMSSTILSPETKKLALGKVAQQQRGEQARYGAGVARDVATLQSAVDEPILRTGAAYGAGVGRSAQGLVQGVSGLVDLATPGKGQSRVTKEANRQAEETDKFVADNKLPVVAYKGGQLTGEVAQLLLGTQTIKAMSKLPGAAKLVSVTGKADQLADALRAVNKGGKAGDAAITAARYLLDPVRVANVLQNTAVDQGQLAAREQDINAGTVATSVGANYALGGVLDAASAGLTRRATNKANVLQDAATAADNARINDTFSSGSLDTVAGSPSKVADNLKKELARNEDIVRSADSAEQLASAQKKVTEIKSQLKTMNASVEPTPTLTQDLPTGNRTGTTTPDESVPMAAQRLEADAIKADLADKGDLNLQATPTARVSDWKDKSVALMDNDFDTATKVAMGEVDSPSGVPSSVVFEAVKKRAIDNKDKMLLYKLSKSNVPSQGKEAGQFIKGFDTRDPSDPVVVMQDVLKARKESKLEGMNRDLTGDEISQITNFADDVAAKKAAIPEDSPIGSPERYAYGESLVNARRYKNDLIDSTKTLKEKVAPTGVTKAVAGTLKSAKATFDNSFFGRQGRQMLTTHPKIWANAFVKSFGDMAKGIQKIDAIDALDAELLSRPNAINGVYDRMKIDLHNVEEAFPTSLPEKIPVLGRLFRASEAAYTGGAHRMRADLADHFLEKASKNGVDMTDKTNAESIGKLVNAMTGRGNLKSLGGKSAETANVLFFSPRNFRANFDTLTMHQAQTLGQKDAGSKFVRKEAAKNLANIVATTAGVMALANQLSPGSVEFDPRSSDFGKIKVGNTRFDITGGLASLANISARLATMSTKSTTTGLVNKFNGDNFGARTGWEVLQDFTDGKLSPSAAAVKQIFTGKNFAGEKITPGGFVKDLVMPLPISNYQELKDDPKSANIVMAMIADGLGVGTNTYSSQKDWNKSDAKKITGFRESVDNKTFVKANNDFNGELEKWKSKVSSDSKYKALSSEDKGKELTKATQRITAEILKKYGYKYETKTDESAKKTSKYLQGL